MQIKLCICIFLLKIKIERFMIDKEFAVKALDETTDLTKKQVRFIKKILEYEFLTQFASPLSVQEISRLLDIGLRLTHYHVSQLRSLNWLDKKKGRLSLYTINKLMLLNLVEIYKKKEIIRFNKSL